MDSFEIIITPDAITDLLELRDYISNSLLAPDTALFYIESIRKIYRYSKNHSKKLLHLLSNKSKR